MRELSQQQTMQKAQKAIQNLQKIDAEYSPKFKPPNADLGYQPKVGEKVRIPRLGQTAEVLGINENQQAECNTGVWKLITNFPLYGSLGF